MNTATPGFPSNSPRFGARHALFALIGLATLFVIYHNERFIVDHTDPQWKYYLPVMVPLVPHGLAGAVALFLGASQFSTRLRQRHARLHRVMGRCYVIGVAIAAPMAIYLTLHHNALASQVAIITTALSWLLTTGVAFQAIRQRDFLRHQQWMMRSYAVTLVFLLDRVLDAFPALAALDTDDSPNMIWICNVVAWMAPTLIIAWRRGEAATR